MAAAAVVAVAGISWRSRIATGVDEVRTRVAVCRARSALTEDTALLARVTATDDPFESFVSKIFPRPRTPAGRLALAGRVKVDGRSLRGDAAARAFGIASLLSGDAPGAIAHFRRMKMPMSADWNDLAVAHIISARTNNEPHHWLEALSALDHALILDPGLAEAEFNRATVVDAMGIVPAARAQWLQYLKRDDKSEWAVVPRKKLHTERLSDGQTWKAGAAHIEKVNDAELAALTRIAPQAARKHADVVYLSQWATAKKSAHHNDAASILRKVQVIGRTLAERGEPLIGDSAHVIEIAPDGSTRQRDLIRGQLLYQQGRLKLQKFDPAGAERDFRAASRALTAANTPMAMMVDFWIGCALTERHRTDDAHAMLTSLMKRAALARYPSLRGHVQYQLALLEALAGNWSEALTAGHAARDSFSSLGERGNAANANALLSESYDFMGQRELAWEHGFAALRDSVADGTFSRTRATLASLCRTELRGGRWERARSLALLERDLALLAPDVRLEPDVAIRAATAEWHLANQREAQRWILRARDDAAQVPDADMRTKLIADIDAVEGVFLRRGQPQRAMALLSSAIAFQRQASRSIILPELYLERGRVFRALNDPVAASRDFEAGLVELERQRTRVRDIDLRPGIFDDASDLFDEAISLAVARGEGIEDVLRHVERGRARAALEEIHSGIEKPATFRIPTTTEIRRALRPDAALIEYVSLEDRLLILAIGPTGATTHTVRISRAALTQLAETFVRHRGADGARLYELLIAPLRNELHGISALNIVPDAGLQRVPFTALFDRTSGTFLVQRYAIATTPSAGVFLATLPRMRLPSPRTTALVFANPLIPRDEFSDLPSLSGAEYEAAKLSGVYDKAQILSDSAATAEQFLHLAPLRQVVQFSGHAVQDTRYPYDSALVCAATPSRRGRLTAREIVDVRFRKTEVVVLSACSTASGRSAAIEGIASLSRAFLVAGVPAVIGTLWDIEDRQAIVVTKRVHEFLAASAAPADALRMAQIEAIRRRIPPSQWAAFSLMGSANAGVTRRE